MITVAVCSSPILGITLSKTWRIYTTEMQNIRYECRGPRGVSFLKAKHETAGPLQSSCFFSSSSKTWLVTSLSLKVLSLKLKAYLFEISCLFLHSLQCGSFGSQPLMITAAILLLLAGLTLMPNKKPDSKMKPLEKSHIL